MTYSDKLKDPRWQRKRLEIFNRDDFTCQSCGSKENTLHVHHLEYTTINPWDEPPKNLKTLCEFCHGITEGWKKNGTELFRIMQFCDGWIIIDEKGIVFCSLKYMVSFSKEKFTSICKNFNKHHG